MKVRITINDNKLSTSANDSKNIFMENKFLFIIETSLKQIAGMGTSSNNSCLMLKSFLLEQYARNINIHQYKTRIEQREIFQSYNIVISDQDI